MRHAKILRALSLPLVTLLGICTVVVAVTPLVRFGTTASPAHPVESSIGGTVASVEGEIAISIGSVIRSRRIRIIGTRVPLSGQTMTAKDSPAGAENQSDDDESESATDPAGTIESEPLSCTGEVSPEIDEELDVAMWSAALRLSDAISTATRYITVWREPDAAESVSLRDSDLEVPQVMIPTEVETADCPAKRLKRHRQLTLQQLRSNVARADRLA